jgi:two-component system, OmpR family, sensor histidine kinase VicK
LLAEETNNLGAEQTQTLDVVLHQTKKLTALVDSFVTMEAAEATAQRREPIDIGTLLKDTELSAQLIARENKVCLKTKIEGPLPKVSANLMAVNQVIDNLVYNAFKYTPENGVVLLSACWKPEKAVVEISVSDTGIGIPAEAEEHIFDRHYQATNASQSRYGGVGLGLALCKTIIEAHGGQIWVDSIPDMGTVFRFTLPVGK